MTWGLGPAISLPTATRDALGTRKFSIGPSAVVVAQPGAFVVGGLVRQLWSVAGDGSRESVNQTLIQPFVNYNLPQGWFVATAPVITANWTADAGERWLVPIGGGVGKILRIGQQPMQTALQAYYNVERPTGGPDWSLRFVVTFLFPK